MSKRVIEMELLPGRPIQPDFLKLFDDTSSDEEDAVTPCRRESTVQYLKGVAAIVSLVTGLCLGTIDCVIDWFIYIEVTELYGPPWENVPPVHIVSAMVVFCLAGTGTYVLESFNALQGFYLGRVPLHRDLLASATLWLEDLPLTVLNTLLVAMVFMPVDAFQMAKAVVVLVGAIARLARSLCRHCQSSGQPASTVVPGPRGRLYLALLISGAILNVAAASVFFAAALHAFRQ